jgi:glycosyltransferase involved in cell wall biosynthesis
MLRGKKIAVTMPAYYAGKTVQRMWDTIPHDVVDTVIFVDDCSKDDGFEKAQTLGMVAYQNEKNLNYGGNVKRCLQLALDSGADVIVLLHPDCQYSPAMVPAMAAMLVGTPYDLCLASRTSGSGTIGTGMPIWKYLPNRIITAIMGACMGIRHTEFHTGYRAYTRRALEIIPFHDLANNFIFERQIRTAVFPPQLGFPQKAPDRSDQTTGLIPRLHQWRDNPGGHPSPKVSGHPLNQRNPRAIGA